MALGKDGWIQLFQLVDDNGVPIPSGTVVNKSSITTFQKPVAIAGTGEQLPANAVPDGFSLVVKAPNTNTGTIYVGSSKANAENHSVAYPVQAGQLVTLFVDNSSAIWIDSTVNGEGVQCIVET